MNRQVSSDALRLIEQWEGLRLTAYADQGGVWTIGYGHTGPDVHEGLTIEQAQATAFLVDDVAYAEHVVESVVTIGLTDNQFGALVSFVFNVGAGKVKVKDGFAVLKSGKPSSLLAAINSGNLEAVPALMRQWDHVGGVVNPGLLNRRNAEVSLWGKGEFVASSTVQPEAPIPTWRRVLGELRTKMHALGLSLISGGTYAAHTVTGADPAKLQDAGQKIQQYAASFHALVILGVCLVVAGVLLDVLKKR